MNLTELTVQDTAKGAAIVPENTLFIMLNLFRYKQQADYGDSTELPPAPAERPTTSTMYRLLPKSLRSPRTRRTSSLSSSAGYWPR